MTGATLLALSLMHGATFLGLRTTGAMRDRAHAAARTIGVVAIVLNLAWVIWTLVVVGGGTVPEPTQIFGMIALIFATVLAGSDYDGWAFAASGFAIAAGLSTEWFQQSFHGHPWFWTVPLLGFAVIFAIATFANSDYEEVAAAWCASVAAPLALIVGILWAMRLHNQFVKIYLWLGCVLVVGFWAAFTGDAIDEENLRYGKHVYVWPGVVIIGLSALGLLVTGGVQLFY